ncbi:Ribokinase-like protein [Thermoascus aurantiacus ATCC 26904]
MRQIIAIGACYLDVILSVDHYPAEDEKLRAASLVRRRGGNCPNTLEVLQQLIIESKKKRQQQQKILAFPDLVLIAVLPAASSPASQFIRDSLAPAVDLTHCIYREEFTEPASSYIIKSRMTGSRTIVNYNELPELTAAEFGAAAERLDLGDGSARWFHFEGRIPDVNLRNIQHVRQRFPAAKVSVEAEKPGRPGLQEMAAEADVVFFSKSWAQNKGYTDPEEFLRAQAPLTPKASLLCCTWGEGGAAALELPSQTYTHCPAYKLRSGAEVVDSIGAGDTFIAGMLYALICHGTDAADAWPLDRAVSFATELAGRKVEQEGFEGLGEKMGERL